MMQLIRTMILVAALALTGAAQSGNELLQRALVKERSEGDVAGAIAIYQRIVKEHASDRKLAARALLQLAHCYERQGSEQARRTYERLLKEFADQPEAGEARARIAALSSPAPAGARVRMIWSGPGVDTEGSVSPDGRWLTYPHWDTGDLGLRDLVAGTNKMLTNTGGWEKSGDQFNQDSRFSPDGKLIAYNWFIKDGYELRVMNADGTGVRTIAFKDKPGYAVPHAWSNSGKYVAAGYYDQSGKTSLHLVTVSSGEIRELLPPAVSGPWGLSFSPDDRFIAYDNRTNWVQQSDLFILPVSGGAPSPLVSHPANEIKPAWSPDGSRVYFLSNRSGSYGVWEVSVANGKPSGPASEVKGDLGARVDPVGLTRDGSLVYGLISGGQEIYVADLDPASGKISNPVLISDRIPGGNVGSAYSPDGTTLAYVTQVPGRGQAEITLRNVATGQERALPARWDVQNWRAFVRWTPDGKSLLTLHNTGPNSREMVLTDIQSGSQTLLHRQDEIRNPLSPCFSADGKRVFFVHRRWPTDEWYVKALDIASRQVSTLARLAQPIGGLAVSPDGKTLAVIRRDQRSNKNVLLLMASGGGELREVAEMSTGSGAVLSPVFSPEGRFVFLGPRGLVRVNLSSGAIEPTGLAMPQIFSPSIHPSGRKIAFQAGAPTTELWIAENFIKSWPSPRAAR